MGHAVSLLGPDRRRVAGNPSTVFGLSRTAVPVVPWWAGTARWCPCGEYLREAYSRRTWVSLLYLLVAAPLAVIGFAYVFALLYASGILMITLLGLPLLAAGLLGVRELARAAHPPRSPPVGRLSRPAGAGRPPVPVWWAGSELD